LRVVEQHAYQMLCKRAKACVILEFNHEGTECCRMWLKSWVCFTKVQAILVLEWTTHSHFEQLVQLAAIK